MFTPPPTPKLFRSEYEQEMEQWLRDRFRYLCYAYFIYEGLKLAYSLLRVGFGDLDIALAHAVAAAVSLGIIVWFLFFSRWKHERREHVVRMATWIILSLGAISLISLFGVHRWLGGSGPNVVWSIFLWHTTACLFLPWTPRESLKPVVPLLALWAVGTAWLRVDWADWLWVFGIVFSPLILMPGLVLCWWRLHRHGARFRTRMIGKQFRSMREEFQRARTIHESMFPAAHDDGHVRFDYTYTPMMEIGGDYIHLHVMDSGVTHLTLIDVTGHGLVAALTVNRLFGELERIHAESPDVEPGEVLMLLNRYFYLTLQRHTIYATAISCMIDPYTSELKWCNAGHPPAYLRGVNGKVRELGATETLLGVQRPEIFDSEQRTVALTPGDVVLAYTDGTFEARDRSGQQYGINRLRDLLAIRESPRNWPQFIAASIDRHAEGRTDDDVLIAALMFRQPRERVHESAKQAAEIS